MNNPTPTPQVPPWAAEANCKTAFVRGMRVAFRVPGAVLFATSIGYGALARDGGFELAQALLIASMIYALPAQVIFVDQVARGAGLVTAAFLVTLTAIRFVPMTVSLMPYLRTGPRRTWQLFAASHFIAVTTWIEASRALPALPSDLRLPHFFGIGIGILFCAIAGTTAGFHASALVPEVISATLLFMTPLYFILSLCGAARVRSDYLAILLGCMLGPLFYQITPGFDLLAAGLIGGTIAHLVRRRGP